MAFSMAWRAEEVEQREAQAPGGPGRARAEISDAAGVLAGFRRELHACLPARADALFELADAVLCSDGPVTTLVELALAPEHRRGHGALYDAVNNGQVAIARLRRAVAALAVPRWRDGRIVLAVDVSPWLRPDAAASPERLFCHVHGRGKGQAQMIPGWPCSFVAALEPGPSSWTAMPDAVRLGPGDDETMVSAAQIRDVVTRLIEAGHWRPGDLKILVVLDAGYDVTRLAWLLADLPVELLARMRADRVLRFPPQPKPAGSPGRPGRHGHAFAFNDPPTWPGPHEETTTDTARHGTARAAAWDRLHPALTRRGGWEDHPGELPSSRAR